MIELVLSVAWCVLLFKVGALQQRVIALTQDVCSDDKVDG
jgi:hypothetical protein